MIQISTLTEASKGRWVVYRPRERGQLEERGRIKGWNAHFVHFVYRCSGHCDWSEDYSDFSANQN